MRGRSLLALITAAMVLGFWAIGSAAAPSGSVPGRLVGLYTARFGSSDEQTPGIWHLRLGPGHHAELWNAADGVANTPSFEIGPVSFAGSKMLFGRKTSDGVCSQAAAYAYSLKGTLLRLRPVRTDPCRDRQITLAPHAWRRVGR